MPSREPTRRPTMPLDETRSHTVAVRAARRLDGVRADRATSRTHAAPGGDVAELRHERFQIGAKLGEGGMGVVYRARDTRDGREVALKLMKGTLAGSARRRFEREFRSLSALHHPHCLGVYDYGELGGGPFFTMELFLGRPITSLAGRGLPERARPAAATDACARLHPRPRHRPPRRQAVEHPGPPGNACRRLARTSRPG